MNYPNLLIPQGWVCPKCGHVWAPAMPGCFDCNRPDSKVTSAGFNTSMFNKTSTGAATVSEVSSEEPREVYPERAVEKAAETLKTVYNSLQRKMPPVFGQEKWETRAIEEVISQLGELSRTSIQLEKVAKSINIAQMKLGEIWAEAYKKDVVKLRQMIDQAAAELSRVTMDPLKQKK